MRILLGTTGFAHPGGSETYLLTMAQQLERLGHDVVICAAELGAVAAAAEETGLRVVGAADEVGAAPAAMLAQDAPTAYELAGRWPSAPLVFRACSDVYDFQLPPEVPGVVACVVACTDRVADRVRATAATHEIVRLRHPVDVRRFQPLRPIRGAPAARAHPRQLPRRRAARGADRRLGGGGRGVRAARAPGRGDARAGDRDERRRHRGRQGAGDHRGHGLRAGGVRLRLRGARRLGDGRQLRRAGGRQLRGDGDGAGRRPGRAGRGPAGLRRGDGRRQPRPGGPPPPRRPPRGCAGRAVPPAGRRRGGAGRRRPGLGRRGLGRAPPRRARAPRPPPVGVGARGDEPAARARAGDGRARCRARRLRGRPRGAHRGARRRLAAYDTSAAERDLFRDDRDAWQARALLAEQEAERLRGLLETRRVRAAMAGGKLADRMRGR